MSAREDLRDALEQHAQQVLEREAGERGVGDALQRIDDGAVGLRRAARSRVVEHRVVDREGGAVGGDLEELGVGVGELARRERADVEDAEDPALDQERDAEQRPDALLAQDRVEDVGVVDVGDEDRAPLGGDPAGEAPADGMRTPCSTSSSIPFAARACSSPPALEQQDRRRVGVQDLRDPLQQLGEQVVERQVRERGVGEPLQFREHAAEAGGIGGGARARWGGGLPRRSPWIRGAGSRPDAEGPVTRGWSERALVGAERPRRQPRHQRGERGEQAEPRPHLAPVRAGRQRLAGRHDRPVDRVEARARPAPTRAPGSWP